MTIIEVILLSVLGNKRLTLNTYRPSTMDGLKGRRKGSGQLSVPELVVPPPDRSTFEMIDNPRTIINGKIVLSFINHDILMGVLCIFDKSNFLFFHRLATEKCKAPKALQVLFLCTVSLYQRTS